MLKPLIGVAVLAATTSAFAAGEYYIVRGPDKHCKIVEERPTTTTTITVVGDTVYKTRSEAQSAIKRVCSTTTSPSTTDDDDND